MEHQITKKRVRDADSAGSESDSPGPELDSPEVKRLRDDLLYSVDDSDAAAPPQDLDSVIKSFAEEICASPSMSPPAPVPAAFPGDTPPDLGFLLGASDDELGLPPSANSQPVLEQPKHEEANPARFFSDSSVLDESWGFGYEIPSYDSFDFGFGGDVSGVHDSGEYMPLGGLFDYSDPGFGSNELTDLSRRSETLPAL